MKICAVATDDRISRDKRSVIAGSSYDDVVRTSLAVDRLDTVFGYTGDVVINILSLDDIMSYIGYTATTWKETYVVSLL